MKIVDDFSSGFVFFVMRRTSMLDIRINIEINDIKMYIIYRDTIGILNGNVF